MKKSTIVAVCIVAAITLGGLADTEPLSTSPARAKYKLGGEHVIVLDHRINTIVGGESLADRQIRELQQKSEAIRKISRENSEERASGSIRDEIYRETQKRWGDQAAEDMLWIVQHESGFNQFAKNKNCCGLFQRLNRCSDEILSDASGQIREGLDYVAGRYGDPTTARRFKEVHGWY